MGTQRYILAVPAGMVLTSWLGRSRPFKVTTSAPRWFAITSRMLSASISNVKATAQRAPLGQGGLLNHPTVAAVSENTGRTPAQVLIRWHIQLGNIGIPKSVNPTRIASNLDVFDFEPSAGDMASISSLDDGSRLGPNPRTFTGR